MAADWSWSEQFDADGIYVGTATCGLPPTGHGVGYRGPISMP